jgi:hypothetical protein
MLKLLFMARDKGTGDASCEVILEKAQQAEILVCSW